MLVTAPKSSDHHSMLVHPVESACVHPTLPCSCAGSIFPDGDVTCWEPLLKPGFPQRDALLPDCAPLPSSGGGGNMGLVVVLLRGSRHKKDLCVWVAVSGDRAGLQEQSLGAVC